VNVEKVQRTTVLVAQVSKPAGSRISNFRKDFLPRIARVGNPSFLIRAIRGIRGSIYLVAAGRPREASLIRPPSGLNPSQSDLIRPIKKFFLQNEKG
jgi:hypothetical protein